MPLDALENLDVIVRTDHRTESIQHHGQENDQHFPDTSAKLSY
jgi:hypothetical protein